MPNPRRVSLLNASAETDMFGLDLRDRNPWQYVAMESEDLPTCADIHEESFSPAWTAGTIASLLNSPGMRGLVALRTGKKKRQVHGFILYRVVADEAEVITIVTARRARRRGAAQELMLAAIRDCLTDRVVKISLEVDEGNLAARLLYASLGFRKAGDRKGYYRSGANPEAQSSTASVSTSKPVNPEPGNALIMVLELTG